MPHRQKFYNEAFTLIELLVVISVISLMASVVLVAVNTARAKASTARLLSDAQAIQNGIEIQRNDTGQTLLQMTMISCDVCDFAGNNDYMTPMKDQPIALGTNQNAWLRLGFSKPPIDPWGNPYVMDANENENSTQPCLRRDMIASAGPDGMLQGHPVGGDIAQSPPGIVFYIPDGGDYYFTLQFLNCVN